MPEDTTPSAAPLAEISLGPNKFEQFLDRNQKSLAVLLALIVIGSAAYIVLRGVEKSREQSAGAALSKANDLASLQAVGTQHANTKAAASSMLLIADKQWSSNSPDAAIKTLKEFIASPASHPAKATASAKLASYLMSQGNTAEASTIFQQITSDPEARYIAPYAWICLGDIAKEGNDINKAESSYNKVKSEFPESSFVDLANERLNSVKAKAPVVIEAPAPEAKKEAPAQPAVAPPAAKPSPTPAQKPAKSTKKPDKKKN